MSQSTENGFTRVQLNTADAGAVINKNIYGQFAEHLGRLFYDGLWVGHDSDIPNTRGWRTDVLEALQKLAVPVLRWPGGCFSDEYRWRDGIGAAEDRPVRVNTLWGGVEESNQVGTHEYFDLVELLGAEAYVNCNMGTGSPREMAEWLEYMTSHSKSDLAELRRSNGRDQPFRLHHFGIGNETWGAGGFMRPEYYCDRYKHWSTMARVPWDVPTKFVASGGHGADGEAVTEWTDYLTKNIQPNFLCKLDAISFHYYSHPKKKDNSLTLEDLGKATAFPEDEWISTLQAALKMEEFLAANRAVLEENDPEGHVGLYVDEWGTWYDSEEGSQPGFLYQQNSLRDALVAAVTFNIFHRYADRVQMANIAQLVNVLQAMILTEGDRMLLTPTYHAFRMYVPFQGATHVPLFVVGSTDYVCEDRAIPAISASAARTETGELFVSLVNTHPHLEQAIEVAGPDSPLTSARGELLTAEQMDAHNTFDQPANVVPVSYEADATDAGLLLTVPAKSVLVVKVD